MWELYDALIEGIPDCCAVEEFVCGTYGVLVRSVDGYGFSPIVPSDTRPQAFSKKALHMPLKELAQCVKSWNFVEASVGLAAINAWYNAPETAAGNGVEISRSMYAEDRHNDPFISYQNSIRNKRVAVIGHFHYLEQLYRPVCDLCIIENEPTEGDYPEPAMECLLPQSDFVIVTCTSIVRKTLPRILELSQNACVVMVGPATPLAPTLFRFGINDLSGFMIKDNKSALGIVSGLEPMRIYKTGEKVSLKAGTVRAEGG